jgi:hypothetical protein
LFNQIGSADFFATRDQPYRQAQSLRVDGACAPPG